MGFTDGRRLSGLYFAEVARTSRITPHVVRMTLAGDDLRRLPAHGYDQWFRLFLPRPDGITDFDVVPERFGIGGYLRYVMTKSGTRPPFRSYTVRSHRREAGEVDVDFVTHGSRGVAGAWAQRAVPGERVALIDQGRGFDPLDDVDSVLLVGDESALPAIAGILAHLPRGAAGVAIIEIPHADDAQEVDAPPGVEVRWLPRSDPHGRPGLLALDALRGMSPERPERLHAYVVGEQALATEGRRHLVAVGVPKSQITFVGYWRYGRVG